MHVVQKSDHNMHNDNPEELIRIIIGDLTGTITHQYQEKLEMYYLEGDETDKLLKDQPPLKPYE